MALSRACQDDFFTYAEGVPARLRAIAADPGTPLKVRVEIEMWFFEMAVGKNAPSDSRDVRALDLRKLTDAELIALADASCEG